VLVAALVVTAAGSLAGEPPVLYRLTRDAAYDRGCYDPCDCLLERASDFRGFFLLRLVSVDPLFAHYEVSGLRWRAVLQEGAQLLSGEGTFRIGGEVALMQEMTLDLSTSGGPPERFESGVVIGGSVAFPRIDITLSVNGMVCFDTVLRVHAAPWPLPGDVTGDRSVGAEDVGVLLGAWGTDDWSADVNADGLVNASDLAIVLGDWTR
jgi:hypothetical protein